MTYNQSSNWCLGIVSDPILVLLIPAKRWRYKVILAGRNDRVSLKLEIVLLQAMKEDPPLDARCRDKFLVQSGPINPDQVTSSVAAIVSFNNPDVLKHS